MATRLCHAWMRSRNWHGSIRAAFFFDSGLVVLHFCFVQKPDVSAFRHCFGRWAFRLYLPPLFLYLSVKRAILLCSAWWWYCCHFFHNRCWYFIDETPTCQRGGFPYSILMLWYLFQFMITEGWEWMDRRIQCYSRHFWSLYEVLSRDVGLLIHWFMGYRASTSSFWSCHYLPTAGNEGLLAVTRLERQVSCSTERFLVVVPQVSLGRYKCRHCVSITKSNYLSVLSK